VIAFSAVTVRTSFIALHILYVGIQPKFIAMACNSTKAIGDPVMKNICLTLFTTVLLAISASLSASAADSSTTELHGSGKSGLKLHKKDAMVTTQAYQSHVWFHSVDIVLSGDINSNGYFHRLEVEIDADSSLNYQAVFAEFSLLPSHGGEKVYYTSSVFELFGQSANDWLLADTILEHRFAPDKYLLTIRLFDANTGYLLAEISGFDDVDLDFLALEDYSHDSYVPTTTTVEVHGGSTGILGLLALCWVLGLRGYAVTRRS
jgi:hypothetical protein